MQYLSKLYTTNKNDPYARRIMCFIELIDKINDGTIICQNYKNKLDENKINEMSKTFIDARTKYNENIFALEEFKICCIDIEENSKSCMVLVDGIHRIKAIEKLLKDGIENIGNMIYLQKNCDNFRDYKNFVSMINITDTNKIPCYKEIQNIYNDKSMNKLKLELKELCKNAFRKNHPKYYDLDEYLKLFNKVNLVGTNFIDKHNQINIKNILKYLKELNNKIKNEYNDDLMSKHTNNFVNKTGIFLTLKRVNIPELIKDPNAQVLINCETTPKRPSISKTLRLQVWKRRFPNSLEGRCYCCKDTMISFGTTNSFHCGHIVAHSLGGATDVNNLEPICQGCNADMGTRNLNDFKKQFIQNGVDV
jgi:hypothetical protein